MESKHIRIEIAYGAPGLPCAVQICHKPTNLDVIPCLARTPPPLPISTSIVFEAIGGLKVELKTRALGLNRHPTPIPTR